MAIETIDHNTLKQLVAAHAVRTAHVIGQQGGWALAAKYGLTERVLSATRSKQVRIFKNLETLVRYLRDEIGLVEFDVNAADYDPTTPPKKARPDQSARMQEAHAARAHDQWFRAEVRKGLEEADDPTTIKVAHQDVMAALQSGDTAALRALAEGKPAAKPKRKARA
jgi:hypothetical protein